MKFGERLHLKLAREPQYPISLGKVEEERWGVHISTRLLSKAGKTGGYVISSVGESGTMIPFLFVPKSGHRRCSMH